MYAVKAVFQNWKALCDHKEYRTSTDEAVRNGDDHDSMNNHKRELHQDTKDKLEKQITEVEDESTELDAKLSNTVTTLIKRGDDFYY